MNGHQDFFPTNFLIKCFLIKQDFVHDIDWFIENTAYIRVYTMQIRKLSCVFLGITYFVSTCTKGHLSKAARLF